MNMDWRAIETITGVVCALAAVISVFVALSLRAAIADLRTEIANQRTLDAEARGKERDELKTWINGSFLRAKVVEAELTGMDVRLSRLEADVFLKAA